MWATKEKETQTLGTDENFTFLGKGVDFKGVFNFEGTVRIDGRLEGEIHTNGTLIVGEFAFIKGIISSGTLICSGKIHGTISALEKVQLLKPAVLLGDVKTPMILVEEGAHIHGMCDMGAKVLENEEVPAKDASDLENVTDLASHRSKLRAQDM